MGKIVALANQKGGVGKTTTAINLAASLAACERRVLLLDLDPQANATSGLGFPKEGIGSVYDALIGESTLESVVLDSALPSLKVVAGSLDLVGADLELATRDRREFRLRDALATVVPDYDWILVDSPPSLGLLTVNGLAAADSVLVPMQCEYFALEGVSQLLRTIDRVREQLNPRLEIEGIVFTMFDERVNLARQVAQEIRTFFGDAVFQTTIPRNVRLGEAPSFGKPILLYDIKSKGSESYLQLAQELIKRSVHAPAEVST